jgi:hypothetical protein
MVAHRVLLNFNLGEQIMKSVFFQTACAFCAAFCLFALTAIESNPTFVEKSQEFACRKCRKPSCKGCASMLACDGCADCPCRRIKKEIQEETIPECLARCKCGDKDQEIACCGKGKRRRPPVPASETAPELV